MDMDFEDIRPYTNEELPHVLAKLTDEPAIAGMIEKYFPQMEVGPFMQVLKQLKTIKEFQSEVISGIVELIIKETAEGLSYDGLDQLDPNKAYLFVSNHRDIVQDSALINYILNKEKFETARIAIGINLLSKPWITHLVKLNKSFVVKRDLPRNEMYAASLQLSSYIRHSITQDSESVWIAQREGRSKDGDDRTHGGLVNMLGMSKDDCIADHFNNLQIVPVSISYEFDPCDSLKLPELYATHREEVYQKKPDEDYNSMRTGLTGKNGRIHISFGTPISNVPKVSPEFKKNEVINFLVNEIDRQIHQNYFMWPSNYIALDLLENSNTQESNYTTTEKENFEKRMKVALSAVDGEEKVLTELYLKIYANPLINQLSEAR